jgi:hypothetical protein
MKHELYGILADRLTVVLGHCGLFADRAYGPTEPLQHEALDRVLSAAEHIRNILREAQGGEAPPNPAA